MSSLLGLDLFAKNRKLLINSLKSSEFRLFVFFFFGHRLFDPIDDRLLAMTRRTDELLHLLVRERFLLEESLRELQFVRLLSAPQTTIANLFEHIAIVAQQLLGRIIGLCDELPHLLVDYAPKFLGKRLLRECGRSLLVRIDLKTCTT